MTGHRLTLVTLAVEGPDHHGQWTWTADGPGGVHEGLSPSEGEAWGQARAHAVKAMARLEAPLGGHELRTALEDQ